MVEEIRVLAHQVKSTSHFRDIRKIIRTMPDCHPINDNKVLFNKKWNAYFNK
jgi:hypothetical protein